MLMSDLHLGHNNICKYRTNFSSADEHHNTIFENLATNLNKRDTLYLLGDVAFDKYWLGKIKGLKCKHKLLVAGNHDLMKGIHMRDLVDTYDDVKALYCKRNIWFSHCPIHPQEMRGRICNIHGHLHNQLVLDEEGLPDKRYINVCVEHTDYKPITFEEIMERGGY